MKNKVMEEIKEFARKKLLETYDFCGAAEGDDMAMLNSGNKEDGDIIINFKVVKDE